LKASLARFVLPEAGSLKLLLVEQARQQPAVFSRLFLEALLSKKHCLLHNAARFFSPHTSKKPEASALAMLRIPTCPNTGPPNIGPPGPGKNW